MISRRARHGFDIWPGFVDALSALLMVIIFVLMAFVLSQFYLSYALSNREQEVAQQSSEISKLSEKLKQEQLTKDELSQLLTGLQSQLELANHDREASKLETGRLQEELQKIRDLLALEQTAVSEAKQAHTSIVDELNKHLEELKSLKGQYSELKDTHETMVKKSKEGFGQFRSEFLAKLQQAVGERSDIRVVGDRFVFQSEVFFELASAELGGEGKKQLNHLAKALKEISEKIPAEVKWILRVDGHTDQRPIKSAPYASNWELSVARALSVVRYLISQGVAPERLVAAGFGEFQPLTDSREEKEMARNRRIEFKLDQR